MDFIPLGFFFSPGERGRGYAPEAVGLIQSIGSLHYLRLGISTADTTIIYFNIFNNDGGFFLFVFLIIINKI